MGSVGEHAHLENGYMHHFVALAHNVVSLSYIMSLRVSHDQIMLMHQYNNTQNKYF